ncbi:MAG TPA: NUDIX domain-containing protein [Gemmatimonadales bacterium]|nr:NUDIX domain-containing protein [Gemmatimonadales bacterium]
MRICFLLGRSFTDRSDMPEVLRLLKRLGATGNLLHLGDDLIDVAWMCLDYDLYVLREKSDLAMSVAADLHSAGAALLNPYPVSAMLRDRIVTFRVLRAAGVPVPETFVASHASQLLPALDRGPLIIKPYRRARKQRVDVVTNAAELAALGPIDEPVFAQRYHAPDGGGPTRKIYAIGGDLFGTLRFRPARTSEEQQARPFPLSPELVDLARRCGAAFGIDLFGVDVVESGGQAYVIDMSGFPAFKGVPDAPLRLAQYIYAAAARAARGEPPVPPEPRPAGPAAAHRGSQGSALELVLQALSTTRATPEELDQIHRLLGELRSRSTDPGSSPRVGPVASLLDTPAPREAPPRTRPRVATSVPARPQPAAALLRHVSLVAPAPAPGVTEFPGQTARVAAASVPAVVRRVSASHVTFSSPHAGDEERFQLEEWITEFRDGTSSTDYIWVRGRYALVVAIADGGVVFVRQYKKAAERTLLVLPWGGIKPDESPLDAGRRELEEETGYTFGTAEVYGPVYDLPDRSTGGHWVIVARDAYRKADPEPDDHELILGVEVIPVDRIGEHHLPVLMHAGALRLAGL